MFLLARLWLVVARVITVLTAGVVLGVIVFAAAHGLDLEGDPGRANPQVASIELYEQSPPPIIDGVRPELPSVAEEDAYWMIPGVLADSEE